MQFLHHSSSKSNSTFNLISLLIVVSFLCVLYLLVSFFLVVNTDFLRKSSNSISHVDVLAPTTIDHVVFGIASNKNSWQKRQEYVKLWWKPNRTRGCVFLDSLPEKLPNDTGLMIPVCISQNTSHFPYTHRSGSRSAIRVARVVSETIDLNVNRSDVRWFVFGDDDTIFFTENLVKTLSKYDHGLWYYIGSNSEIYEQDRIFGFEMAFGGGGFAISYPLAKVLTKVLDSCIYRYPSLYGSDARIYSCLAELGVSLTHEPGFHQMDIRGDLFGLLASHPMTPLVSLHHLDNLDPIFPNTTTMASMDRFFKAVKFDSQRVLQKTVCYDRSKSWTISISWGYAVEVYGNHVPLPDTLPVQTTFRPWKKSNVFLMSVYTFNVREPHRDPCRRPTVFFMDDVYSIGNVTISNYSKSFVNCSNPKDSPRKLDGIKVFTQKLDLTDKQLRAPRRHCCNVLPSSSGTVMELAIRECREDELISLHQ